MKENKFELSQYIISSFSYVFETFEFVRIYSNTSSSSNFKDLLEKIKC